MDDLNRIVGENLRRARRARGWSLVDVENESGSEFKASVLGAYERGERALSVGRLWRLAQLYGVTAAGLFPSTGSVTAGPPIVVDLTAAEHMNPEQAQVMDRYLAAIQVMRSDPSGPALTVRHSDLRVLAALLETQTPAEAIERLSHREER